MHTEMWEHPAVAGEPRHAARRGVRTSSTRSEGRLAGGDVGKGRLAAPETIVDAVERAASPRDLDGLAVLVTAGGTREPIDPVRFIANRSSGKQGHALAPRPHARRCARSPWSPPSTGRPGRCRPGPGRDRSRDAGRGRAPRPRPTSSSWPLRSPTSVRRTRPREAQEGRRRPGDRARADPRHPRRARARKAAGQVLVGFAAETNDLRANAAGKLTRKGARPDRGQRRRRPRASGSSTTPTTWSILGRRRRAGASPERQAARAIVLDRRRRAATRACRRRHRRSTQEQSSDHDLDLHLGVGHRGPSRQDGRPDLRRHPRRDPRPGPDGPRGLRDAADDRAGVRRR